MPNRSLKVSTWDGLAVLGRIVLVVREVISYGDFYTAFFLDILCVRVYS